MGWTEFRDLSLSHNGFSARAKDLSDHSHSLGFLYSQEDHWGPVKHMRELEAGLPNSTFQILDAADAQGNAITHDFVTATLASKHVAEVVCEMLTKLDAVSEKRCALKSPYRFEVTNTDLRLCCYAYQ